MPTWFLRLMEMCEGLALDSKQDQQRLWALLAEAIPRPSIRQAISEHLEEWLVRAGGMTRTEVDEFIDGLSSSTMAAAVAALEES